MVMTLMYLYVYLIYTCSRRLVSLFLLFDLQSLKTDAMIYLLYYGLLL